ncbi:hypothetical protein [Streptococcus oricebi]|uniref:Flagellar FliJ protein n=1 Tax=Streptococcus oricebi TaxID=1547447 RepID=A0ABS5B0I1_9STRE|nr:hypothetical protein [Streptococcus oricebi]MBP2622335.1 hypothetical protein [Streptococcus oricebi]
MDKWEELAKKEKAVTKLLEKTEDSHRTLEYFYEELADYQAFSQGADEQIWQVAYQSRYRSLLENQREERQTLQRQAIEELEDWSDMLKKEEQYLINQKEELYQAKRRAFYQEEED